MMNVRHEVAVYLDYCKYRKELAEKTLKAYRIDLQQFFSFCNCDIPEKEIIEQFIIDLHKRYKQKTVKRKIASIKAFYNFLEQEEIIEYSPFRKIKVQFKETAVLPRIISRKDIERLLNYMYACQTKGNLSDRRKNLRDIAVVEMLFSTGARVYEISNIAADCIDMDSGLIRIMGKGGRERYLQISDPEVLCVLKKYYEAYEELIKKTGFFFINQRGGRYTEQSIRNMIRKYALQAGIEKRITPHMFRHSVATYLIEEGVDISLVRELLGHSSIRTTQIYIHIALQKQIEVLKNLHPRKRMNIRMVA